MTHESPAQGRASADARDADGQSTGPDPQGSWGKVPKAVGMMVTLRRDALRLFILLSSSADGRTRLAWPSQTTLAQDLGWITRSTGKPDRRRVANVIKQLNDAGVIREAGIHRHGERAWTNRYLVAPFPAEDADTGYASSPGAIADDAYETDLTMRINRAEDADPAYAQTDQATRPGEPENIAAGSKSEPDLLAAAVELNMQSANDDEIRAAWRRKTAHA